MPYASGPIRIRHAIPRALKPASLHGDMRFMGALLSFRFKKPLRANVNAFGLAPLWLLGNANAPNLAIELAFASAPDPSCSHPFPQDARAYVFASAAEHALVPASARTRTQARKQFANVNAPDAKLQSGASFVIVISYQPTPISRRAKIRGQSTLSCLQSTSSTLQTCSTALDSS